MDCSTDSTSGHYTGTLFSTTDDGRAWNALPGGGGCAGPVAAVSLGYVGFTDDSDGVALSYRTTAAAQSPGSLYLTRAGGSTWTNAIT